MKLRSAFSVFYKDEIIPNKAKGQRNKFCVGDTIEIMKPDGSNVEAKVLGMYNEEGEAVESCPHSKQVLYVQLDGTPQQYDLMRVKAN